MKRGFDRKARVADVIQKSVARIIMQELPNPHLKFVTITDVILSKDLSYAKIFVTVLQDEETVIKEILKELNREAKAIRHSLAKAVNMRIVPELKFVYDESTAHGFHISSLIDSAMKKTGK